VHGYTWQEQPFINGSREIGYNLLSNWFGTQQIGANDKLELLTGRAGGTFGVAGDYLFNGVLQAANPQNLGGMWGLMRVTPDAVAIADVQFDPAGSGNTTGTLSVSGAVTKAATSAMASAVAVYKVTDLDAACAPDVRPWLQKLGEAAVNADGSWVFKQAGVTIEEGAAIRVISNLAVPWPGQATVDVTHPKSTKVITTGGGSR